MEFDTSNCMWACCIFVACASPFEANPLLHREEQHPVCTQEKSPSVGFIPQHSTQFKAPSLGNTRAAAPPSGWIPLTDYCSDTMPSSL